MVENLVASPFQRPSTAATGWTCLSGDGCTNGARVAASQRPSRASHPVYSWPMTVRVALAEDNYIVREGIAQVLSDQEGDVEVVARCEDVASLLRAVEEQCPDVVVTDIRMPPTNTDEGIRLAATLRDTHPGMGVVVLSNYAEPAYALALLESGSEGRSYLLKERVHDRAQLVSAIQTVAAGGSAMDPKIIEPLMRFRGRADRSPLANLTSREREVLAQIAQGHSNAAIADSLVLTKRAVEKHINSIFLKLNLAGAEDISKRVKAALLFLAESDPPSAPRV
jgi:DNA-binding NarL/FixJ family response regulator